jgi:hypothetical protein
VAPEACQDVLDHRPIEPAALSLQAGAKNLVQASEAVDGGVQHRERIRDRRRQLRHRDGTHPERHRCRARLAGPCSNALDPGAMLRLEIFKCLLRRLHRLGPRCRLRRLEPSSSSPYGGDIEAIKAKIISHPHYYSLLAAYLEYNKVGAPPEVSARLTEIAQEVETRQHMALGGLAATTEPELDQFMEAYHEMLVKFREELTRPLQEAMEFMRRVESQLNSLSISGRSLCNILSSGHWQKSATPTNISQRWAKMAAWRMEWGVRC